MKLQNLIKKVLEFNYPMFTNKKISIGVIELGKMGKDYLNIFSFLNSVNCFKLDELLWMILKIKLYHN